MTHEIWLFTLVHVPIGWSLDEFTLVDDVSGDFNANVTYSVKQLTASLVDETSVHFGFIEEND